MKRWRLAMRWWLAAAFGILIALVALGAAAFFVAKKSPALFGMLSERLEQRLGAELREAFGLTPKLAVSEQTILAETKSIAEIATAQRSLTVKYDWQQTWLGSTKTIRLEGNFVAKAGFDLRDAPKIVVSGSSNEAVSQVTVEIPEPKLLSCERTAFHIAADENGWWNYISAEDREAAETALANTARSQAVAAGMLDDAKRNFTNQLQKSLTANSAASAMILEVHFQKSPAMLIPSASPRE